MATLIITTARHNGDVGAVVIVTEVSGPMGEKKKKKKRKRMGLEGLANNQCPFSRPEGDVSHAGSRWIFLNSVFILPSRPRGPHIRNT